MEVFTDAEPSKEEEESTPSSSFAFPDDLAQMEELEENAPGFHWN
jgi:hypothetical protein